MRDNAPPLTTPEDRLLRALSALGRGEPIVLEIRGDVGVVISAETLDARRLDALRGLFGEETTLAVTKRRADILRARAYDGDLARIRLRPEAALIAIQAIADPTLALAAPLAGPHDTARGGDPALERAAIALCRRARLLPAALIWRGIGDDVAIDHDLNVVDAAVLTALEEHAALGWREVVSARVPIAAHRDTRLRLFRRRGGEDEHYVVEVGAPDLSKPVLARLHSACATGDLFGSLKCDCGPQLEAALSQMGAAGGGVLVYLLQEGRGIGLANKLRAYRLQEDGFDTVEANHRLGFDDDERLLGDGGQILATIGARRVRLLTNNPAKVAALEESGVEVVSREALIVGRNALNDAYLDTKAEKSGHLL